MEVWVLGAGELGDGDDGNAAAAASVWGPNKPKRFSFGLDFALDVLLTGNGPLSATSSMEEEAESNARKTASSSAWTRP